VELSKLLESISDAAKSKAAMAIQTNDNKSALQLLEIINAEMSDFSECTDTIADMDSDIDRIFDEHDADKSGYLDSVELPAFVKAVDKVLGFESKEDAQAEQEDNIAAIQSFLKAVDSDNDGKLSKREVVQWLKRKKHAHFISLFLLKMQVFQYLFLAADLILEDSCNVIPTVSLPKDLQCYYPYYTPQFHVEHKTNIDDKVDYYAVYVTRMLNLQNTSEKRQDAPAGLVAFFKFVDEKTGIVPNAERLSDIGQGNTFEPSEKVTYSPKE